MSRSLNSNQSKTVKFISNKRSSSLGFSILEYTELVMWQIKTKLNPCLAKRLN